MENVKIYFGKNSEQVFALTLLLTIVAINYFFPFKLVFLNVYYFPSFFMPAFTDLDLWMNILAWSSFLILTGVVGGRLIHGLKIELEEAEKNEERLKSHARPLEQLKESTIIGPSISVKGELTGEGDLTVQGQVEGQIDLKQSHVTIGRTGRINADVYGKITAIEGEVQGNLFGEEKIVLRQSAVVRGDMRAPRIKHTKLRVAIDSKIIHSFQEVRGDDQINSFDVKFEESLSEVTQKLAFILDE